MDRKRNDQVKVIARIRPTNNDNLRSIPWEISAEEGVISLDQKIFQFDRVYEDDASTEDIYHKTIKKMIPDVVKNGLNGIVMAYGQTSSGKTYTMQGNEATNGFVHLNTSSSFGILHLVATDIFSQILNTPERDFTVQVSCFEVYNEKVRDLLDLNNKEPLKISRDNPNEPTVKSLDLLVSSRDEMVGNLMTGLRNRTRDSTNVNGHSSRSHCITRITIESDGGREIFKSELTLVDLAGSESLRDSLSSGHTQLEGSYINKSLLALSNVINALGKRDQKVFYRDSKLTEALQSPLNGNAKISIICCVSPAKRFATETKNTFRFAQRAKEAKVNAKPNRVKDHNESIIRFLKAEITRAHFRLEKLEQKISKSKEVSPQSESEKEEICCNIEKYESFFARKQNEKNSSSSQYEVNNPTLKNNFNDSILTPTRLPSDDEMELLDKIGKKTDYKFKDSTKTDSLSTLTLEKKTDPTVSDSLSTLTLEKKTDPTVSDSLSTLATEKKTEPTVSDSLSTLTSEKKTDPDVSGSLSTLTAEKKTDIGLMYTVEEITDPKIKDSSSSQTRQSDTYVALRQLELEKQEEEKKEHYEDEENQIEEQAIRSQQMKCFPCCSSEWWDKMKTR